MNVHICFLYNIYNILTSCAKGGVDITSVLDNVLIIYILVSLYYNLEVLMR